MKNEGLGRQRLLEDIGALSSSLPDGRYRDYVMLLSQTRVPGGMEHQIKHLQTVYDVLSRRREPVYLHVDLDRLDTRTRALLDKV